MAANAPAEAIDASLIVATRRGDCQKLKDLIIEESKEKSSPAGMYPLLIAAACKGSLEELKFLLNRGPLPRQELRDQLEAYPGNSSSRSKLGGMSAASSLEGVTVEGDTVLHLLAANGRGDNFMNCANLVYGENNALLYKQNYNGDTPLHCAMRAGNSKMVAHLIGLARGENRVEDLLRKENNSKETALHEAVRIGDNHIVKELLRADSQLARFPEEGPSALYIAVLLEEESIAQTLYDESEDNVLSYTGPDGQNALHAAVLWRTGMLKMLLEFNKSLTSEVDYNGSTPLHFLSSRPRGIQVVPTVLSFCVSPPPPWPIRMLLDANPAALYQADNSGMSPIHVAASVGADITITRLIDYCPSSAALRDTRGRTFLHIAAADSSGWRTVAFACRTPSLAWILNMQDTDGNTALHLSVRAGCLRSFSSLLSNPHVHLNLANKKGQTPLDISRFNWPRGMKHTQSNVAVIHKALSHCGASYGGCRWDHFMEAYTKEKGKDFRGEELEKLKDSTRTLSIGSVLIAMVAFTATFTLPGGYRADDTNGGTPILAGRYTFDAFVIAITLAFICSSVGTIGLMFSGSPMIDFKSRRVYYVVSVVFVSSSVTSLTAAFALGAYMVLALVTRKTAVAISVVSPLVVICIHMESFLKWAHLARLCSRIGLIPALIIISNEIIGRSLLFCWPILVIFGWPAIARNR
ncbi:hypothetical protein EJB05_14493, partial [Eragrostis curvula]